MENTTQNYIAYFDETGDDGNNTNSSDTFLLTSMYMPMNMSYAGFNALGMTQTARRSVPNSSSMVPPRLMPRSQRNRPPSTPTLSQDGLQIL